MSFDKREKVFNELISRDPSWAKYLQIGSWRRDLIEAILLAIEEPDARAI